MHRAYNAERNMVIEVVGVVDSCGVTAFVYYDEERQEYGYCPISDCVPYRDELRPDAARMWPDKQDRESRTEAIRREEKFQRAMDTVAKTRERVFNLKRELEKTVKGIRVTNIGLNEDLNTIEIGCRVEDEAAFYGKTSAKESVRSGMAKSQEAEK